MSSVAFAAPLSIIFSRCSDATAPNVFRAVVVAAILSSFFWTDGSLPASRSFFAPSRFPRASAGGCGIRSQREHLFDAREAVTETPKLAAVWLDEQMQATAVWQSVGLSLW